MVKFEDIANIDPNGNQTFDSNDIYVFANDVVQDVYLVAVWKANESIELVINNNYADSTSSSNTENTLVLKSHLAKIASKSRAKR